MRIDDDVVLGEEGGELAYHLVAYGYQFAELALGDDFLGGSGGLRCAGLLELL